MPFKTSARAHRVLRGFALAAIAGAAIYALTPAVRNQFGSVRRADQRVRAENFTVQTLNGDKWSLEEQRGKVVLVNFWATWCPPCQFETPSLVRLYSKYAARGFTVAGITLDESPEGVVPAFVDKHKIAYPILRPTGPFPLLDRVEALPTSVLIDRSGRVARTYEGLVTETGLRDDVEALLSEPSGGV